MHCTGIIIKPKSLGIKEARRIFGNELIRRNYADYYLEDDKNKYCTFDNGSQTMPLDKYKEIFIKELDKIKDTPGPSGIVYNNTLCFGIIECGYVDEFIGDESFFEFHDLTELRNQLISTYIKAYKIKTLQLIDERLKSKNKYNVVLIDYHI